MRAGATTRIVRGTGSEMSADVFGNLSEALCSIRSGTPQNLICIFADGSTWNVGDSYFWRSGIRRLRVSAAVHDLNQVDPKKELDGEINDDEQDNS